MIKEKLKSWEYYYNKLPLFFKNSHGISDHFKILFNTLVELDYTADDILKGFDVFAEDYVDYIYEFENRKSSREIVKKLVDLTGATLTFNDNRLTKEKLVNFINKNEELFNTEVDGNRVMYFNYDYFIGDFSSTDFEYIDTSTGLKIDYYDDGDTYSLNPMIEEAFWDNNEGLWYPVKLENLQPNSYTPNGLLENRAFIDFITSVCDVEGGTYEDVDITNQYEFDLLEKLAEIYGITRYFDIKYYENDILVKKSLKLTNTELHKLLLTRIVQANYNGTYEDARELYDKIGLPIYMINDTQSATVSLYLDYTKINNENIIDMFKANLFTLNSLGITYLTSIRNVSELSTFDNENHLFDKGLWS